MLGPRTWDHVRRLFAIARMPMAWGIGLMDQPTPIFRSASSQERVT